jgi:hypothetical protein
MMFREFNLNTEVGYRNWTPYQDALCNLTPENREKLLSLVCSISTPSQEVSQDSQGFTVYTMVEEPALRWLKKLWSEGLLTQANFDAFCAQADLFCQKGIYEVYEELTKKTYDHKL